MPPTPPPHRFIRLTVALGSVGLCALLVASVSRPAQLPVGVSHTLSVLVITLVVYAWGLFSTAGSVFLGVVALLCQGWAWAASGTSALGIDIAALLALLAIAASHQRRQLRRLRRMQQLLDDVEEEQTVKHQAITVAQQTRGALQKKLARYTQLQAIADELSSLTDLTAITQLAVERAFSLIGKSDVCLLFLIDQERQELSLFASKKREPVATIRAKHGDQFDRYVLRTHRPLLVNDVRRDFRFTVPMSSERTVTSVIACPVFIGQTPEGVLRLDSAQAGAYTQDDLRFLDILLDLVSTAVTNARLFAQTQQLAMTDGLTGLTLRRPFLEQLTREVARAGRSREPVSVVMLDVDHFKAYNDTFGHSAGDLVLKSVAEMLREAAPPGAVMARYGGEEFAVLLPRIARPQAGEIAERIRHLVERGTQGGSHPMGRVSDAAGPEAQGGAVTASLGVATFPDDAQADMELLRIADERLYAAKHAGRNLVMSV